MFMLERALSHEFSPLRLGLLWSWLAGLCGFKHGFVDVPSWLIGLASVVYVVVFGGVEQVFAVEVFGGVQESGPHDGQL